MFAKIITVFTFLAMAMAAPHGGDQKTTASEVQAQQCGNNATINCCNHGADSAKAGGLLALSGLENIAGGTCETIPVSVAAVLVPFYSMCGDAQTSCCSDVKQNGPLNIGVQCTPVSLF